MSGSDKTKIYVNFRRAYHDDADGSVADESVISLADVLVLIVVEVDCCSSASSCQRWRLSLKQNVASARVSSSERTYLAPFNMGMVSGRTRTTRE